MLSAAAWPTMLEDEGPAALVAASVAIANGQHAFAFFFR